MRTLPVDRDTLKMLKEYIDRGGPVTVDDKQLLFSIGRRQACRIISYLGWRAGLGRVTNLETGRSHHVSPHRLRDAFATHAVKIDDSGDGLRLL